ncbi:MAG TPA: TetR/AcrR family transcriptional regulator [Tepidisphaeraceae bacterium]|jgi:AcrR family transcriptional regulator
MQRPDEAKRLAILDTAARLFATRPFHEVRLEDVAQAAHIGKGTVYLYFKSKDELFASLVLDGYARLVEQLRVMSETETDDSALRRLEIVVRELVTFAKTYPYFYSVMRDSPHAQATQDLCRARESVGQLAGKIIRDGVTRGELDDPRPEVTGQFIPACVRSAIVFGPGTLSADSIVEHVMRVIGQGVVRKA